MAIMEMMTSQEIIKLLDLLVGNTEAVGDDSADRRIEDRLKVLIDVTNWCLDGVLYSSATRHNLEKSMRDIGERAFFAMCEWREWLDERITGD